jgi:hypothetical protein
MPLRSLLHGTLGDQDGVRPQRPLQSRTHVLVGAQQAIRVIDRRTDQEGAGLRIVRGVGKGDLAGVGKQIPVAELDLDHQLVVGGQLQQPLPDVVADALDFVLGDAEVHPHRREHRDGRQLAVLRADIGAFGDGRETRHAGDRRSDPGVREIELCRLELRLRLRDGGASLLVLALRVVEVFLRQGVLLDQRLGALEIGGGHLQRRLVALQCRRRAIDLHLERLRIDLEQQLAGLHHRALGVHALVEEAGNARLDIDRLRTLGLATYSADTGTSRASIVSVVTSSGGGAGFAGSRPQAARAAKPRTMQAECMLSRLTSRRR